MSRGYGVPEPPGLSEGLVRPPEPKLPISARSLTADEVAVMESRVGMILMPIFIGGLWLLFFLGIFSLPDRQLQRMFPILFVMTVAGTGLLLLSWWWRQKRRQVHCATPIRVEVGRDGITVTDPDQVHLIPYEQAEYRLTTWSNRYVTFFLGIRLETPIGRLRLEDGYFEKGTDAAEAIMQLCGDDDYAGLPRVTR